MAKYGAVASLVETGERWREKYLIPPENYARIDTDYDIVLDGGGSLLGLVLKGKISYVPTTENAETARTNGDDPRPLSEKLKYLGDNPTRYDAYKRQMADWLSWMDALKTRPFPPSGDFGANLAVARKMVGAIYAFLDQHPTAKSLEQFLIEKAGSPQAAKKILGAMRWTVDGNNTVCEYNIKPSPCAVALHVVWSGYAKRLKRLDLASEKPRYGLSRGTCAITGREGFLRSRHPLVLGNSKLYFDKVRDKRQVSSGDLFTFSEECGGMCDYASDLLHATMAEVKRNTGLRVGETEYLVWSSEGDVNNRRSRPSDESDDDVNERDPVMLMAATDDDEVLSGVRKRIFGGAAEKIDAKRLWHLMTIVPLNPGACVPGLRFAGGMSDVVGDAASFSADCVPTDEYEEDDRWTWAPSLYTMMRLAYGLGDDGEHASGEKEKPEETSEEADESDKEPKKVLKDIPQHAWSEAVAGILSGAGLPENLVEDMLYRLGERAARDDGDAKDRCVGRGGRMDMVRAASALERYRARRREKGRLKRTGEEGVAGMGIRIRSSMEETETMTREREIAEARRGQLFGRLYAATETLERQALYMGGTERSTHASNALQHAFREPASTWDRLQSDTSVYRNAVHRLALQAYENECAAIMEALGEDYNNKPVKDGFWTGYYPRMREYNKEIEARILAKKGKETRESEETEDVVDILGDDDLGAVVLVRDNRDNTEDEEEEGR